LHYLYGQVFKKVFTNENMTYDEITIQLKLSPFLVTYHFTSKMRVLRLSLIAMVGSLKTKLKSHYQQKKTSQNICYWICFSACGSHPAGQDGPSVKPWTTWDP
jgi:hypothetical protein